MLIKGQQRKPVFTPRSIGLIALGLLILLLFTFFSSRIGGDNIYFCDMESRFGNNFSSGGHTFTNAKTQSDEKVFQGSFSSKLTKEHVYGPGMKFTNVNSGDVFEAGIWRNTTDGFGNLAFQGNWDYFETANVSSRTQGEWEYIEKTITIPLGVERAELNIYPYNSKKEGTVYFDNLKIKRIKSGQAIAAAEGALPLINLRVDPADVDKLRAKRSEAFARGNLITGKKDLVPARLEEGEDFTPVKIRLKGDLLDHLKDKKWSFRIRADKGNAWNGLTEFSAHKSVSRHHLNEWVFHQLLIYENILTNRYDFFQLSLNDEVLGIYAYEEHFNQGLLQNFKRAPGPIIRISEEGMWLHASKTIEDSPAWFESGQIEAIDAKGMLKDDLMYQKFLTGQSLYYDFINGNKTASEVFDPDILGKFLAIQDVCGSWHAFNYTNLRVYYNAHTGLLEPIGYDGFNEEGLKYMNVPTFTGAQYNSRTPEDYNPVGMDVVFHKKVFNDLEFVKKYLYYLEKFSQEEYITAFLETILPEIKKREKFIQLEYANYKYNWKNEFRNAAEINKTFFPMEEISLKAYRDKGNSVILENYHYFPLEVVGYGDQNPDIKPKEKIILEAFHKEVPVRRYPVVTFGKPKNIFVKVLGTSKVVRFPVYKWPAPQTGTIAKVASGKFVPAKWLTKKDSTYIFKPGEQVVNEDIIIPEGFLLRIPAGTNIKLSNNASLVSYGVVLAQGTKENPIFIQANNEDGGGVLLVDVGRKSIFKNVYFKNLSRRKKDNQQAEGSVTLYRSDADFQRCFFYGAKAENALNLIHSNYTMADCHFDNSSGDALDVDYSNGKIRDIYFTNTGKDALEVSGGFLEFDKININKTNESGININYHGRVEGKQADISEVQTGISSRDLSYIIINDLNLKNAQKGLVAYEQLAQFGAGNIYIKKMNTESVETEYFIQQGAVIEINGKKQIQK